MRIVNQHPLLSSLLGPALLLAYTQISPNYAEAREDALTEAQTISDSPRNISFIFICLDATESNLETVRQEVLAYTGQLRARDSLSLIRPSRESHLILEQTQVRDSSYILSQLKNANFLGRGDLFLALSLAASEVEEVSNQNLGQKQIVFFTDDEQCLQTALTTRTFALLRALEKDGYIFENISRTKHTPGLGFRSVNEAR